MAIEKGANCLINIAIDLIPSSFEFYRNPLTLTDQFMYLFYADVHTLPFKIGIKDSFDMIIINSPISNNFPIDIGQADKFNIFPFPSI